MGTECIMHLSVFIYNRLWKGIRSAHFFFLAKYCLLMLLQTSQNQRLPFSTTAIYINQCKFSECNNFFTTGFISPSSGCFFSAESYRFLKLHTNLRITNSCIGPRAEGSKRTLAAGWVIPPPYPSYTHVIATRRLSPCVFPRRDHRQTSDRCFTLIFSRSTGVHSA